MEDHSEARGDVHGLSPVPRVELCATLRQQTQLLRESGADLAGLPLSLLSLALGFLVAHARILRTIPRIPQAHILGSERPAQDRGYAPSCIFMRRHNILCPCRVSGPVLWGVSGAIGPGLCKILDTNFREYLFHVLR